MKVVVKKKSPCCYKSIGRREWTLQSGVRIDSLRVIACSINPKVMCEEVPCLAKRFKLACIQALRVFDGKTLFYSLAKTYLIWQIGAR